MSHDCQDRGRRYSQGANSTKKIEIEDDGVVKGIAAKIGENRDRLSQAKQAQLAARKELLQIKKDIEAFTATLPGTLPGGGS